MSVIVTVCKKDIFKYDMELPEDVPCEKLIQDIAQVVEKYDSEVAIDAGNSQLYSARLHRVVNPDEALNAAKVWSGDILNIL